MEGGQPRQNNTIANGNKKQRVKDPDDVQTNQPEDTRMKEENGNMAANDHDSDKSVVYRDILDRNVAKFLERENVSKKTTLMVKLKFKPVLELKFNGSAKSQEDREPDRWPFTQIHASLPRYYQRYNRVLDIYFGK